MILWILQTVTRVKPYICTMPLKLDEGWNQIQLNLADFTRRAYGTNYVETLRVQVHANCRLRRIYFSDRLYSEEELPPEFKLYLPVQQVRIPCTAPLVLASSWLLSLGVCFTFLIWYINCRKHEKVGASELLLLNEDFLILCHSSSSNQFYRFFFFLLCYNTSGKLPEL